MLNWSGACLNNLSFPHLAYGIRRAPLNNHLRESMDSSRLEKLPAKFSELGKREDPVDRSIGPQCVNSTQIILPPQPAYAVNYGEYKLRRESDTCHRLDFSR